MHDIDRTFYGYLSLHSLLIGVFPFFLPVYLWKQGFGIAELSIFIGISGFAFCLALWLWDHIRAKIKLLSLIGISLLLEISLLQTVLFSQIDFLQNKEWLCLLIIGINYGAYNCFFWTTQRALFFEHIDSSNSGRRYGNVQIYVGLVLQIGILIGGLLIEKLGIAYVLGFSVVASVIGFWIISKSIGVPAVLNDVEPLSIKQIFRFKDQHSSVTIFLIDGIYLFLESFFWVISLFLLAHESFVTLGLAVISLAIIFGILFYFLKNTIDRLNRWRVYSIAVILYVFSWALRANIDENLSLFWLFLILILITFCTSFFRLAMNKRFYDLAKETLNHQYLVLKSYYSQFIIGVFFIGLGLVMKATEYNNNGNVLVSSYWIGAVGALCFLLYGANYAKAGIKKETKEK